VDRLSGFAVKFLLQEIIKKNNNCEEEDDFIDYAPCAEMHPMYQVTRVSSITSSAATCAQRKE